jgi:transcriptional regulator with XRE-family HTH domain
MVTSAQLRAARAYLGWTMQKAAMAAGLHRRTIIRLENNDTYVKGQPPSLTKLVAIYRDQRIILDGEGLAVAGSTNGSASVPRSDYVPRPVTARKATQNS